MNAPRRRFHLVPYPPRRRALEIALMSSKVFPSASQLSHNPSPLNLPPALPLPPLIASFPAPKCLRSPPRPPTSGSALPPQKIQPQQRGYSLSIPHRPPRRPLSHKQRLKPRRPPPHPNHARPSASPPPQQYYPSCATPRPFTSSTLGWLHSKRAAKF
jgi:hypothetical protein